jgi:hypothetical protein
MVNIEKLYDRILDILKDYRCQYTDCDEGGCSLVDVLTPPDENDIKHGTEELEMLAEYLTCRLDDIAKEEIK